MKKNRGGRRNPTSTIDLELECIEVEGMDEMSAPPTNGSSGTRGLSEACELGGKTP